jgi:division protein CdvB (Snf7/Vps24/ESCRT-III family)
MLFDRLRQGRNERKLASLEVKLNRSLTAVNASISRLNKKYSELEAKGRELFERCVHALSSGDEEHAKIYADEIIALRRLAKIIMSKLILLEQVKVRLETVMELTEVLGLLSSLRGVVQVVARELSSVTPDVAVVLNQLSEDLESLVATTSAAVPTPEPQRLSVDGEAEEVLEMAKRLAAERVRMSFPDVPVMSEREKAVYELISSMGDSYALDIGQLSKALGLSEDEVEEVLESLANKGLIEISYA